MDKQVRRLCIRSAAISLLLLSPDASSASSLFAVSPFPSSRANSYFCGIGYFSASSEGSFCISFSRSAFFPFPDPNMPNSQSTIPPLTCAYAAG